MSEELNNGHGHVFRRPDGVLARCGGPGLCVECSKDLVVKNGLNCAHSNLKDTCKFCAYEAEIEELKSSVDKWMGEYQRIYNDWGGQNEFLKRENDDLKAQLSVALEAMLYAEKHLTGTALDKVQSAIQQIEVNKSPG